MSDIFMIKWQEVKGALVSGILMALFVIAVQIIRGGTIFGLDWKNLANIGVLSLLTFFVSYFKQYLTTSDGRFVGRIKIR